MRILLCLTVALVACGGSDAKPSASPAATTVASTLVGPDPLFLRIPHSGGPVRVVAYPKVDSVVWTSSAASPAPGRVLGFDDDAGLLAMIDSRGRPVRIDFRRDSIELPLREALTAAASLDASSIYGIPGKGAVVRTVTTAPSSVEWRYSGPRPARGVLPLRDGTVLVWSDRESFAVVRRLRPPETKPTDSLVVPAGDIAAGSGVGDRLYFVENDQLYAVQTRTLQISAPLDAGGPITGLAVSPSGDRVYALATIGGKSVVVAIDRYRWKITSKVALDAMARGIRVDPIGRYVLVQLHGDSVAVVTVATNRVIGSVRSDWREDLPLVAPDGSLATALGGDVLFVRAEDQTVTRRVAGGASDFWFPFWWTGFRPRAAALDVPVTFDSVTAAIDSATTATVARADTAPRPQPVTPAAATDTAPKPAGFTVSFFALLSQQRAQSEASKIRVGNEVAHVETVMRSGVPVYRVILGPYPTCAEAQRTAKASGTTAWIPEGGCPVLPPDHEPLAR